MRTGRHSGIKKAASAQGVHPRAYGGRFSHNRTPCSFHGFIPVHTGQILNFSKISETTKSLIPSQIPAVGSVCITFSECVFADNTFWSKNGQNDNLSLPYMLHHNKMTDSLRFSDSNTFFLWHLLEQAFISSFLKFVKHFADCLFCACDSSTTIRNNTRITKLL